MFSEWWKREYGSLVTMLNKPELQWRLAAVSVAALTLGAISAFSLAAALIAFAACLTLIVGWWAQSRGDALVVAVALLVFWAPFHMTVSRFNISPQEVAVYFLILMCLMLERQSMRAWVKDCLSSIPRLSLIAIGVFALACLQSVALESGVSLLDRVQALRSTVLYPVLFALLVTYTIRVCRAERVLLQAFFWGATLFAVYALALKLWGVDIGNGAVAGRLGAESSFLSQYHPNNLGLYLALALPFALPLWYEAATSRTLLKWKRMAIIASASLMFLDILLAASIGTLVALAISSVVTAIILLWQGTAIQRVIVGVITLDVVVGIVALGISRHTAAFGRYAQLLNPSALLAKPNVQFRIHLYQRALQLVQERPLTGIGLQGFASTGAVPFSPHDTYLDLWVGAGIFALLAFLFILAHGIISSFRWIRRYAKARNQAGVFYSLSITFALVAFIAQAFTETFDAQPRIAPAIWMLALVAQVAVFSSATEHAPPPPLVPVDEEAAELDGESLQAPTLVAQPADQDNQAPTAEEPSPQDELEATSQTDSDRPPQIDPQSVIVEEAVPVIQDDPFAISGEFDAVILQAEARTLQRTAASGDLTRDSTDVSPGVPPGASAPAVAPTAPDAPSPQPETAAADSLLKRAPSAYLWNQIYSLLIFGLNFALSVIIARGLSATDFGVYSILSTIVSTLLLLFAFGLEDATSVFVPRLLSADGPMGAARLIRRMLVLRTLVIMSIGVLLALGLPLVAGPMQDSGIVPRGFAQSVTGAAGLRAPLLGAYLAGSSIVALQGAFFASVLKTRATLIIGGVSQALGAALTLALLSLGYGIDGIFAAQVITTWAAVAAFLIVLRPYLIGRTKSLVVAGRQVRSLMVSAWLTNISNGALGKQMDIMLMSFFAVSYVAIGYYNLAYQLVSVVSVLLISGLGGISIAALSVAYAARGSARLVSMWRAILTLHILLAVPLQVLTFVLADQIIMTIYGERYAGSIPLLRIFLIFSILGRMLGGGANQSALYVLGKQRTVLMTRYTGFALNLILDVLLIQLAGPAGALVATGVSQLWVGAVEFIALRGTITNHYPLNLALRVVAFALFAAIPTAFLPITGLFGLVSRSLLFGVLFVMAALVFRLGDSGDIVELAALNPRYQWLITLVTYHAARLPIRNRKAM